MATRLFDIAFSVACLLFLSPVLVLAALAIKLSSPGPVFYRAQRVGRHGVDYSMFKFRTMHVHQDGAVITAHGDKRIFRVGAILRKTKIDELPQFINVLAGQMRVVGPRPEDPHIVRTAYSDWMKETLDIAPGITSPGAIYYYAYGEGLVSDQDPEGSYVQNLLPPKLAIERAYMDRQTLFGDLFTIAHTAVAIVGVVAGRPVGPLKVDTERARQWLPDQSYPGFDT